MFQDQTFISEIFCYSLGLCPIFPCHTLFLLGHTLLSVGNEMRNSMRSGVCGQPYVQVGGAWVDYYSGLITRNIFSSRGLKVWCASFGTSMRII